LTDQALAAARNAIFFRTRRNIVIRKRTINLRTPQNLVCRPQQKDGVERTE
jgi:hypothetical protein